MNAVAVELIDLLGGTRADIADLLRSSPRSVAELAVALELSEAAIRRHLQVLERNGLVTAQTVRRDGPGRPSAYYALTDKAMRLFPDRSAEIANELL
ncbi:MAG TPA: ArsR family transcriptional regulator, partial [Egibacteraceae bacterium]|nr:ArsR family transcriptional regulator [Egibacteraceae bacterium]